MQLWTRRPHLIQHRQLLKLCAVPVTHSKSYSSPTGLQETQFPDSFQPQSTNTFRSNLLKWKKANTVTLDGPLKAIDGKWLGVQDVRNEMVEAADIEVDEPYVLDAQMVEEELDYDPELVGRHYVREGNIVDRRSSSCLNGLSLVLRLGSTDMIQLLCMDGKTTMRAARQLLWVDESTQYTKVQKPLLQYMPDPFTSECPPVIDFGPYVPPVLLRNATDFLKTAESEVQRFQLLYREKVIRRCQSMSDPKDSSNFSLCDFIKSLSLPEDVNHSPWLHCAIRRILHLDIPAVVGGVWNQLENQAFQVSSLWDIKSDDNIATSVERYLDEKAQLTNTTNKRPGTRPMQSLAFNKVAHFINITRQMVLRSRRTRSMLDFPSPYQQQNQNEQFPEGIESDPAYIAKGLARGVPFDSVQKNFIRFFYRFAMTSEMSMRPREIAAGGDLLRELRLYPEYSRFSALVLLKELGVVSPWYRPTSLMPFGFEDRAFFSLEPARDLNTTPDIDRLATRLSSLDGLVNDTLADLRYDFGALDVFCIDHAHTGLVDDGLSLEAIPGSREHWVHIHCSNPASSLHPFGSQARCALAQGQDWIISSKMVRMLSERVRNRFSLQPGSPTLTVSLKMDADGNIRDSTIWPGRIHKVHYVTVEECARIVGARKPSIANLAIQIGKDFSSSEQRPDNNLNARQRAQLCTLFRLHKKIHRKFALNHFPIDIYEDNHVHVKINGEPPGQEMMTMYQPHYYTGELSALFTSTVDDPELPSFSDMVATYMRSANSAAGKWCAERKIPAMYQTRGSREPHEAMLEDQIQKGIVKPFMQAIDRVPREMYMHLKGKVSPPNVEATPFRNITQAADSYVRITSSLRRADDLVNHWQICKAIRIEAENGRKFRYQETSPSLWFDTLAMKRLVKKFVSESRLRKFAAHSATHHWEKMIVGTAFHHGTAPLPKKVRVELRSNKGFNWMRGATSNAILLDLNISCCANFEDPQMQVDSSQGDVWEGYIKDVPFWGKPVEVTLTRILRRSILRRSATHEDCELLTTWTEFTPEVAAAAKRASKAAKDTPHIPIFEV